MPHEVVRNQCAKVPARRGGYTWSYGQLVLIDPLRCSRQFSPAPLAMHQTVGLKTMAHTIDSRISTLMA
jgi:hypothetical protein